MTLKTSHIQELKRRYASMYTKEETLDEHCGVCDEQGIEEAKPPRKLAKRDVGMECMECGNKFRAKLSTLQYGKTKCPNCKSTDLDFAYGESVEEEVELDEATGNEIKKYMKSKWGISVKASKVGTGKFMRAMGDIPNEFRAKIIKKFNPDAKIMNKNNINYGNIRDTDVALKVDQWDELMKEEVEIDEAFFKVKIPDVAPTFIEASSAGAVKSSMRKVLKPDVVADLEIERVTPAAMKKMYRDMAQGKDEVDESVVEMKSSSGYELYHKDFSSAMQHAYAFAKKKGNTIDPKEIDDKVATGPKKPSKGKINRYSLKAGKKLAHIQVANLDDKKYELNMYFDKEYKGKFEEVEIEESNELQAIMALDDVGIKATINKKDQVVVKKKDLKKAEDALKKSFRKGGAPELHVEEVEIEEGTAYPPTIDNLRMIVKDKQHQTFMFKSGQAKVDLFTASAMVQVYDALKKPEMKKTFEKMIKDKAGFLKTQAFAMKMLSGGK